MDELAQREKLLGAIEFPSVRHSRALQMAVDILQLLADNAEEQAGSDHR